MFQFSSRSTGEALSGVELNLRSSSGSSLKDRWALVSLPFFIDFEFSSYMFYSYFVLSLDVCIVTITWSLLFVFIAMWIIYLTR
jgi:hypothetical protein